MKTIFLFFVLFFFSANLYSQLSKENGQVKRVPVSDGSIVKDSSGVIYQPDIWRKLLLTGYYYLKPENSHDKNTAFLLIRRSEGEKEKILSNAEKPKESKSFITGKEVKNFSTTDMNGKKYKLKDLKGKIVILNFWFINCPPCRAEILELNKLVREYKDSSDIVFLAIALDNKSDLMIFLKSNPFDYAIIDSGRDIANQYDVTAYPTHAVIDQQGKAYFHTTGTGSLAIFWLRKSIEELLNAGML